jgi:hypothetical protein
VDTLDLGPLPLGRRIKVLRIYAGDEVSDVAARWGKTTHYVYRVEKGEKEPTPLEVKDLYERAIAVAEALAGAAGSAASPGSDAVRDATAGVLGSRERRKRDQASRYKRRSTD